MKKARIAWNGANGKMQDFLQSFCFIGPSFLGVLLFFIVPFGVVVDFSGIKGAMNPEFVFLENFRALIENSAFRLAAKNTATFSAVAVPLAVILSLCLALMLECRIP
jgi:multiple sugar transport system permease protein